MNLFGDAFGWLADPANWTGAKGVPVRLLEHLGYTLVAVAIAAVIAIPLGYLIGHTGRGRNIAVVLSGAARALPTLGLFVFLLLILAVPIGSISAAYWSMEVVLVLLAIPSVLAGAYSGLEAIDRTTIDSARSVGMTELQILSKVEVPLGLPLLIGGLRAAFLQVIATVTIGAYAFNGGFGRYIFEGLASRDYALMLAGSLLVTLLAVVFEGIFIVLQRVVVPRGVSAGQATVVRGRSRRSPRLAESTAE